MRSLALVFATAAVVAVPVALQGAEPPAKQNEYTTKKVCVVDRPLGSRLLPTRRCRTQAEEDERRAQSRRTVERVQTMKATSGR